ncbi:GBS Bsp-like repeat-containing protein [Streptococcus oricebi]
MRKKDLIYLASTAVLLAASSQQVFAEDLAPQAVLSQTSESKGEGLEVPSENLTTSQEQASSQTASLTPDLTKPATESAKSAEAIQEEKKEETAASSSLEETDKAEEKKEEEDPAKAESSQEETSPKQEEADKAQGQTRFFNSQASSTAPKHVEPKGSFVDVSSHNGEISVDDYRQLVNKGITGVVVKLTEGTSYKNPYAQNQIRNAQAAGLQVSAYAFSHYTSAETARAEANYFAQHAKSLNLPMTTLMVNDMEDPKMQTNINPNTQIWAAEMKRLGFSNLMYYTSASWIDNNNLRNKGPVQTAKFGLQNFWVAQYPSRNLNQQSATALNYNNGAGAWQFTSQAQLLAGKHVFDQSLDYTGRFTKHTLRGKVSIENNNSLAGTFDVVVSDVAAPFGVREVMIPTWSEVNGQDDLVWHKAVKQANGTYRLTVKASEHKNSTGTYHIHVYYTQNNGKTVGVARTKAQVEIGKVTPISGKVSIQNNDTYAGSFDVVVSDAYSPKGIKEVLVPVWSSENGQDDLVWHKAHKQVDGNYRLTVRASEHKNSTGNYHVHVYYMQNNGEQVGIASTVAKVDIGKGDRPRGKVSIQNNDTYAGSFDVVIGDTYSPKGIKEVLVPVWSSENGQDDLVWHKAHKQADGNYRLTVRASEHKNSTGNYHVHVYYMQNNGEQVGIASTVAKVDIGKGDRPRGKVSIQNNNAQTSSFDVVISDTYSPKGIKEVLVPVWSSENGQDDLVWHKAHKQVDGNYRLTVRASEHKNSTGNYHVHVYYMQNNGEQVGIGSTNAEVKPSSSKLSVRAVDVNQNKGTYKIVVDQAAPGKSIKEVKVAVWSEANQKNLSWYTAPPKGANHAELLIDAANHNFASGDYTTHIYVTYLDNSVEGYNAGSYHLTPQLNQRDRLIQSAAALVGVRGGTAEHHQLVNDYNSVKPLPVGYAVKYSDDWCDVFTTVVFQRQGLSHLIGRECGVERHIQIFKHLGIWNEDGNATPQAGDIITFNWDQNTQQNNGWADHIGIVEKVENGIIHTIEGNSRNEVKRNTYRIGHGNIRGFASPRYQ